MYQNMNNPLQSRAKFVIQAIYEIISAIDSDHSRHQTWWREYIIELRDRSFANFIGGCILTTQITPIRDYILTLILGVSEKYTAHIFCDHIEFNSFTHLHRDLIDRLSQNFANLHGLESAG